MIKLSLLSFAFSRTYLQCNMGLRTQLVSILRLERVVTGLKHNIFYVCRRLFRYCTVFVSLDQFILWTNGLVEEHVRQALPVLIVTEALGALLIFLKAWI